MAFERRHGGVSAWRRDSRLLSIPIAWGPSPAARTAPFAFRATNTAGAWLESRFARRSVTRVCRHRWLLLALALIAAPAAAQVTVVDDTGAPVTLAAPARRIVALAPHATELVYAAGAGERIVGVVKGSDYPPDARKLPVVGDAAALDLERIVMLAPDLIVTWPWTMPAQVAWLRARRIAVFEADARTPDGIADDIERIGALAGTQASATPAANALRARIARLAQRDAAGDPPLRVFYQVSDAPLYTLGGRHLVSEAIAQCGGRNVFSALTLPAPQVGVEAVLAADPQVIVAGTDGAKRPAWLDRWGQWPALDAVRRHALYVVDANLLHRPGPRFVDGIAQLCDALADARRARR
jgi:iron complex transport system substrate-binding protein